MDECNADRTAMWLFGSPVNYDKDGVQTTGPGTDRPAWVDR